MRADGFKKDEYFNNDPMRVNYGAIDPGVQLRSERLDFHNPEIRKLGLKRQWKYKLTDTSAARERAEPGYSGTSEMDKVDFPLRTENLRNYHRIRDSIASLNVALSEYARKLSAYVSYSSTFRDKYVKCRSRLNQLEIDLKEIHGERLNRKEMLMELRPKYEMIENALKKAGVINQEKKKSIDKIRVSRDKCLQTISNRKGAIEKSRDQNAEMKRRLTAKLGKIDYNALLN